MTRTVLKSFDRVKHSLSFEGQVSKTKPSFRDECDINKIMERAISRGMLPAPTREAFYGDFSSIADYQTSLQIVMDAQERFANLPAAVRKDCDNDPSIFLEKVKDPEWIYNHGLAKRPRPTPSEMSPNPSDVKLGVAASDRTQGKEVSNGQPNQSRDQRGRRSGSVDSRSNEES